MAAVRVTLSAALLHPASANLSPAKRQLGSIVGCATRSWRSSSARRRATSQPTTPGLSAAAAYLTTHTHLCTHTTPPAIPDAAADEQPGSSSSRSSSSSPTPTVEKFTFLCQEAAECLEDAEEHFNTIYFTDDMRDAEAALETVAISYKQLVIELDESTKKELHERKASIGVKIKELKAHHDQLEADAKYSDKWISHHRPMSSAPRRAS